MSRSKDDARVIIRPMSRIPAPVPTAAPPTSPPSGVVYVGPSLGRSLVGLAAAVLLPPVRTRTP